MAQSIDALSLLNKGIYPVAEAARLTRLATGHLVSPEAVRRWLWGYRYQVEGDTLAESPPLWQPDLPLLHNRKALSFRDLIEVMFVAAFRRQNISLQTIRRLIDKAIEHIATSHPLSSPGFKTDGKRILAEVVTPDERRICFDLESGQYLLELVFDRIRSVIEYSDLLTVARWWPLGKDKLVVVDPARGFGQPIDVERGVPTVILASAFRTEGSYETVSYWYGVSSAAAQHAVEYEHLLAAA